MNPLCANANASVDYFNDQGAFARSVEAPSALPLLSLLLDEVKPLGLIDSLLLIVFIILESNHLFRRGGGLLLVELGFDQVLFGMTCVMV